MYIKKLIYKNVGPISSNNIDFRFTEDGNPVPVIIVGENGTGKSLFLSNITDAFYELAGRVYQNAVQSTGQGHQFYKTISPDQIKLGSSWLAAYMEFEHDSKNLKYIFKSGNKSYNDFVSSEEIDFDQALDWKEEQNYKNIVGENKIIENIFDTSVVACFSPMRYEKPSWMGNKYYDNRDNITFSHKSRLAGVLNNPITVDCNSEKTLEWLFDVITDSRADLERIEDGGFNIVYPSISDINLLSISRNNAEKLMSEILGQEVIFRMGNRSQKGRRLLICNNEGETIAPSLDALSTGQLALLNMFSSIIRYADNEDINLSFKLNEIEGIVLIDEIELHLHSNLQREVLPKLISLFPKVQFIITSHSPLFLIGMQELYGEDNIDIYEMPDAKKIQAEDFSEFGKAYQYYANTQKYRKDIKEAIDASNSEKGKALVITEGSTDWKHLKAAYNALIEDPRCRDWLPQLDFEFFEYEPLNSDVSGRPKIQMSCSELVTMCNTYCKLNNFRKMIFIADNDDEKTTKKLSCNEIFKSWGNGVYSFCLPVPEHRPNSNICIEHLYRNDDIKRSVTFDNEVKRRIFLGSEFDATGHLMIDGNYYFCNAMTRTKEREKNAIVDGSDDKKVIKLGDDQQINYALPKSTFANYVLEKHKPFENMDFEAFIPVFERIRDILNAKG